MCIAVDHTNMCICACALRLQCTVVPALPAFVKCETQEGGGVTYSVCVHVCE